MAVRLRAPQVADSGLPMVKAFLNRQVKPWRQPICSPHLARPRLLQLFLTSPQLLLSLPSLLSHFPSTRSRSSLFLLWVTQYCFVPQSLTAGVIESLLSQLKSHRFSFPPYRSASLVRYVRKSLEPLFHTTRLPLQIERDYSEALRTLSRGRMT